MSNLRKRKEIPNPSPGENSDDEHSQRSNTSQDSQNSKKTKPTETDDDYQPEDSREDGDDSRDYFLASFKPSILPPRKLFHIKQRKPKLEFSFPVEFLKNEPQKELPLKLRKKTTSVPLKQVHIDSNFTPSQSLLARTESLSLELSKFISLKSRNFLTHEWFYSDVDLGFFRSEFGDCMSQMGYGGINKVTRLEWGAIRKTMGLPRRFSPVYLREERDRLEAWRNQAREVPLNMNCDYFVRLPSGLIVFGKLVKWKSNNEYEVKFHDSEMPNADVHDTCLMSCSRLKLNIDLKNLTHFSLKLKRKQEVLNQLKQLNDLYENRLHEQDFEIKYAWLLVQLKEVNAALEVMRLKRVEIPRIQILLENSVEKAKLLSTSLKLEDPVAIQSLTLLYQLQACMDNPNLSKSEIDKLLLEALDQIKPSQDTVGNTIKSYVEIRDSINQIKKIL